MNKKIKNISSFVTCFVFAFSVFVAANFAYAGELGSKGGTLGIAAVVNDEVITFLDLQKRAMLVMGTSGIKDDAQTRRRLLPQVLRALIDEKLKLQEAKKNNIEVDEKSIGKAIAFIEKQNNISKGGLKKKVENLGLGIETLEDQVRPEVAWMALVSKKLSSKINVSAEEVEEIVAKLEANKDKPKRLVSEIFLPVENPIDDVRIKEMANHILAQIKAGGSFSAMARQFSQSPTSSRGGDLEWVFAGQLDEELESVLDVMSVGEVSEPVRALDGYHVLFLRAVHGGGEGDKKSTVGEKYFLSRIILPKSKSISALKKINKVNSCNVFNKLAAKIGADGSGYIGQVDAGDMSKQIKNTVKSLPIGKPSRVLKLGDDKVVMMVCNKQDSNKMYSIPSKEVITNRLRAQRLEMHARRYLRDLRREAIIDIRL
ncbi:MAG: hypothetical protein GY804_01340 [Alphaproteobacteria bacterium]|nr:hypothetical protein [Alphaproteobacteria bacterium]